MRFRTIYSLRFVGLVLAVLFANAGAAPVVPANDAEVVEHLPARLLAMPRLLRDVAGQSTVDAMAAARANPAVAANRARALLDEARDRGDPRYAGYALAAIAPWRDDAAAPPPIAILAATLAQYQHDFDSSRKMLEAVLVRDPGNPQATLTLATIARVQGRYADSDTRCREVSVALYQSACLAENMALRGQVDEARRLVHTLLATPRVLGSAGASLRQWLLTTQAELEERAGNEAAADAAYRQAMALGRDSYLILDYVDFLIAHRRDPEAERLLVAEPQPYGDGVLLRLAIVQKDASEGNAKALAVDLHERFEAAKERGDAISIHGRELARALFAVEGDAKAAVVVARDNLRIQKEPADFLVMAEAARAAGDRDAIREVAAQAKSIGLVDRRLTAITDDDVAR
ncbi:MAG: hypothetical protein ABI277_00050 [Burkholderiaceae bacterium]